MGQGHVIRNPGEHLLPAGPLEGVVAHQAPGEGCNRCGRDQGENLQHLVARERAVHEHAPHPPSPCSQAPVPRDKDPPFPLGTA